MRARYVATAVMIGLAVSVAPAAGQKLPIVGLRAAVPIEERADAVVVFKPHEKHTLFRPATIDRVIDGEIIRIEKGVRPKMIVHLKNAIVSKLEAGVPVKLFLKEFKDGHAHYIIGVFPEDYRSQP